MKKLNILMKRMTNYTLFAQKKERSLHALFEPLIQALEYLNDSTRLMHQIILLKILMPKILEISLMKLDFLMECKPQPRRCVVAEQRRSAARAVNNSSAMPETTRPPQC